jgi:hypothetical protein
MLATFVGCSRCPYSTTTAYFPQGTTSSRSTSFARRRWSPETGWDPARGTRGGELIWSRVSRRSCGSSGRWRSRNLRRRFVRRGQDHPNDIDGYFVCDLKTFASGELQRQLNLLDPHKVWTWDPAERRAFRGYPKKQLPMWHQYRVELYPHYGQFSGIRDSFGNELEFPSAFRLSRRDGKPRGIIKIGGAP